MSAAVSQDILPADGDRPRGLHGPRRRLLAVALVLLAVLFLRAEVVRPVSVASTSMEPTVRPGAVVVVDLVGWRPLRRGDLVVFSSPEDGGYAIKRVVGLGGDVVAIEDAVLVVDGRVVDEPFVDHDSIDATYFGPVTVPAGAVFVLGDNRSPSIDSRDYGAVPLEDVMGRVLLHTPALWVGSGEE